MPHAIIQHPLSYQIGPLQITGFGVAVLLAFVIAQLTTNETLSERGQDPSVTSDCVLAAVIGGLLGAKIYYAILTGDPSNLFHRAGFVFWGGLAGGIVATALLIRLRHWSFAQISDAAAPGLAAAYAIGRTGCWAVGDDYGRPWNSPFAVAFPDGAPPSTAQNLVELFHLKLPPDVPASRLMSVYPTELFEVALGTVMFLDPVALPQSPPCRRLALRSLLRPRGHRAIRHRVLARQRRSLLRALHGRTGHRRALRRGRRALDVGALALEPACPRRVCRGASR